MTLVEIDPHGAARIQTIAFAPPRGVRVLRGKLADLVAGQRSSDFVKAVLTDETPLIDPMKRLRETYPHACYLGYAHDERAPETKSLGTAQIKINDPIDVIGDFLTHVRGEPASEVEAKLLGSALHHLQSEEDQL